MTEKPFRIQKNNLTGKYSYFYPTGLYPSISAEDLLEVLILHLNNEYQCKIKLMEGDWMTSKPFRDMTNEEIIEENNRIMNQTEKLLKAIAVIQILTIIGMIILILMKLNVI